jgi:hypothetical protein
VTRHKLLATLQNLTGGFRRAFAIPNTDEPLSSEETALLERLAEAVVARGMAAPATMFLESLGPMNFLGSQALHFFTPILEVVFPHRDVERVARLLEKRQTLGRLTILIEHRAETHRTERA